LTLSKIIQTQPNDGGLQLVGDLGVNFEGTGDMDIQLIIPTALAVTNNNSVSLCLLLI
jgi:hypothetical protein